MALNLERIDWMPSPPLVPDQGPLDLSQLGQSTFGDDELARGVLAMFAAQSAQILSRLKKGDRDAGELAHKLKGSALAIGAHAVAAAAEAVELGEPDLTALERALADAQAVIAARLRRA